MHTLNDAGASADEELGEWSDEEHLSALAELYG